MLPRDCFPERPETALPKIAHDQKDRPEKIRNEAADQHHNEDGKVLPELRSSVRKQLLASDLCDPLACAQTIGKARTHSAGKDCHRKTLAHKGLLDVRRNAWNKEILERAGLDLQAAPELVPTGTDIGSVSAELQELRHFTATRLIAPACYDTASAGQPLERIYVVGGGSLNPMLNRLKAEATGLPLSCGAVGSSTIGNFAVQLAALKGASHARGRIRHWASVLTASANC